MNTIEQITTYRSEADEIRAANKVLDRALTDEELDGVTGGAYRFVRAGGVGGIHHPSDPAINTNAQLWVTTAT